mmetsp:Transcript_11386/g.34073  ORF Transcript_11386/g.34073 Transcript_11386/m.34073 type:complete len:204 (-) Transcript_11386:150-761(-)
MARPLTTLPRSQTTSPLSTTRSSTTRRPQLTSERCPANPPHSGRTTRPTTKQRPLTKQWKSLRLTTTIRRRRRLSATTTRTTTHQSQLKRREADSERPSTRSFTTQRTSVKSRLTSRARTLMTSRRSTWTPRNRRNRTRTWLSNRARTRLRTRTSTSLRSRRLVPATTPLVAGVRYLSERNPAATESNHQLLRRESPARGVPF